MVDVTLRRDTPKSKAWADKRTTLPRGKGLNRGSSLPRTVRPMRRRSPELAAYYQDVRRPLVERMTTASACEAPVLFALHSISDPLPHCSGPLDVHERRRRSQGGSLETPENLLVLCRAHHSQATDAAPRDSVYHLARIVAFEGDDGWEALGARRGERKQR